MIEQLIEEHQKLLKKVEDNSKEEQEFYNNGKANAEKRIDFLRQMRDNDNQPIVIKCLAGHLVANEISIMRLNACLQQSYNYSNMLALMVDCILKNLDSLLEKNSNSANEKDKELIAKIQHDLSELQKASSTNQEYIDMLRIGIEKKNKWLNDNR